MRPSLRQRIFWWSAGSALGILLIAFLVVNQVVRGTIREQQAETLAAQTLLLAELQSEAVDNGLDRTIRLSRLPTLRAAIETRDSLTIRQSMETLAGEAGFSWLMLTTPAGELVTSTADAPVDRMSDPITEAVIREAQFYDTGDLWRENGQLTQVHATAVFIGSQPIAVLLAGLPIGDDRVELLRAATGHGIAFISAGEVAAGRGTLSEIEQRDLLAAWDHGSADAEEVGDAPIFEGEPIRQFTLAGHTYIGTTIPLPNARGDRVGRIVAFRSLDAAMQPARDLSLTLLFIGSFAVLIAFVSSYLLSSSVTGPVSRLLEETVRIGAGNLDEPVAVNGEDEVGALGRGFEEMRRSLLKAREELLRTERLSAIGRASSAIVHDFRQPVSAISGHVSMLRLNLDDPVEREEDLIVIEEQLQRLSGMMSEILDFARGSDSLKCAPGTVSTLFQQIENSLSTSISEKGLDFHIEAAYDGEWILDWSRTRRILENLLRNAIAATPEGGRLILLSDLTQDGLLLLVEDTGPGIPTELHETLFEPFVTFGKADGTGLGLAIVRTFTEQQGGTVRLESSGHGTRFLLTFPERHADSEAEAAA